MNIQKEVSDLTINLKEQDILDRFYDRLRWPKKYPWGQPSIEVIKEDQEPHQDFFMRTVILMWINVFNIIKMDIVWLYLE